MKLTVVVFASVYALTLAACPTGSGDDDDALTCDLLGGDEFPEVTIADPENSLVFGPGESISWVVLVEDVDGDVSQATLEALDVSNNTPVPIDVDLPSPNDNGRATFFFEGGTLDAGINTIRIKATDDQGCEGDDQVVICVDIPQDECPS